MIRKTCSAITQSSTIAIADIATDNPSDNQDPQQMNFETWFRALARIHMQPRANLRPLPSMNPPIGSTSYGYGKLFQRPAVQRLS